MVTLLKLLVFSWLKWSTNITPFSLFSRAGYDLGLKNYEHFKTGKIVEKNDKKFIEFREIIEIIVEESLIFESAIQLHYICLARDEKSTRISWI